MLALRALCGLALLQSAGGLRKRGRAETDVGTLSAVGMDVEQALDHNQEAGDKVDTMVAKQDALDSAEFISRRRRRRRNRRRRHRRRFRRRTTRPPCAGVEQYRWVDGWLAGLTCCQIETIQGHWGFLRSIAYTETLTISYGYFNLGQSYNLDATYRQSMTQAAAGFSVGGFGGGGSYSSAAASVAVSSSYIFETVNFNLTWTGTWTNTDGRYLYQWVWTSKFKQSPSECQLPDAVVGTNKIVQSDTAPKCLPGMNLDARYQTCYEEGKLRLA